MKLDKLRPLRALLSQAWMNEWRYDGSFLLPNIGSVTHKQQPPMTVFTFKCEQGKNTMLQFTLFSATVFSGGPAWPVVYSNLEHKRSQISESDNNDSLRCADATQTLSFSAEYLERGNTIFIFLQEDSPCITMRDANEIKLKCIHIKPGSPCHLASASFILKPHFLLMRWHRYVSSYE